MKQTILFFVGIFLGGSLWAQKNTVIRDPNASLRSVKGYHGIEVSSAIDLYLSQGGEETVVVSADDIKWRDRIRTEVVNGILRVWLDYRGFHWGNHRLKAYISFIALDYLSASGASNIYVDGIISGKSLSVTLSGASDFKGAIKVDELSLKQSGASDSRITGSVMRLATMEFSGASNLKGYELAIESCNANASGASDIRITVNKELNVIASGASSVYYKGEGTIGNSHVSGASNVGKKA